MAAAEKQGVPRAKVSGTTQNDILKEYIARGTYIYPPRPSMRLVTDIFEFCSRELPRWNTISISGYHMREAGATAAQELAFTMADAIAYVEAAVARGLDVDAFAGRLSFFFAAWSELFEEVAKFRAARRLWARIMKERFGATDPRSMMCRFHVQTAGSLADGPVDRQQRGPDDRPGAGRRPGRGPEPAHEQPRRGAGPADRRGRPAGAPHAADPGPRIRGHRDARPARRQLLRRDADERAGGAAPGASSTRSTPWAARWPRSRAASSSARSRRRPTGSSGRSRAGDQVVVGINAFRDEEARTPPTLRIDPEGERRQVEAVRRVRAERDPAAWAAALRRVEDAARGEENVMPALIEAVKAYATVGEISNVLRAAWGEHRELVTVLTRPPIPGRLDAASGRHVPPLPAHIRSVGRVHHVAVVVRAMDAALAFYRDTLGLAPGPVVPIPSDRVSIAFLPVGEVKIELVEPTDDTTGVARFLASRGEGFHHVCFEVPDISAALTRLGLDGVELIDTAPRPGAEGPVAFLHPRSCHGVLVELIEAPGGPAWASLYPHGFRAPGE